MKLFARSILASAVSALMISSSAFGVGAIAVDDAEGETEPGYGLVTGKESKDEAKAGAIESCKQHGNKNCEFKVWFETCGAYAASKKHYGIGYGKDKATAEGMAKEACGGDCAVVASECE